MCASTLFIFSLFASLIFLSTASVALLDDGLTLQKTLIDRAIEARSGKDVYEDNKIALKVNAAIVEPGTIRASSKDY